MAGGMNCGVGWLVGSRAEKYFFSPSQFLAHVKTRSSACFELEQKTLNVCWDFVGAVQSRSGWRGVSFIRPEGGLAAELKEFTPLGLIKKVPEVFP